MYITSSCALNSDRDDNDDDGDDDDDDDDGIGKLRDFFEVINNDAVVQRLHGNRHVLS